MSSAQRKTSKVIMGLLKSSMVPMQQVINDNHHELGGTLDVFSSVRFFLRLAQWDFQGGPIKESARFYSEKEGAKSMTLTY